MIAANKPYEKQYREMLGKRIAYVARWMDAWRAGGAS